MNLDCTVEDLTCIQRVLLNADGVKQRELVMWFRFEDGPRLDKHLMYSVSAKIGKHRQMIIESTDLREALAAYNGLSARAKK